MNASKEERTFFPTSTTQSTFRQRRWFLELSCLTKSWLRRNMVWNCFVAASSRAAVFTGHAQEPQGGGKKRREALGAWFVRVSASSPQRVGVRQAAGLSARMLDGAPPVLDGAAPAGVPDGAAVSGSSASVAP